MTAMSIRRVQAVCFVLAHIPLAAAAPVLAADGLQGDLGPIAAVFAATLVTAVSLVIYLGHALSQARPIVPRDGWTTP